MGKTEAKTTRRVKATTASLCMAERICGKEEYTLGKAIGAWPSLINTWVGPATHRDELGGPPSQSVVGVSHGPFHFDCQVRGSSKLRRSLGTHPTRFAVRAARLRFGPWPAYGRRNRTEPDLTRKSIIRTGSGVVGVGTTNNATQPGGVCSLMSLLDFMDQESQKRMLYLSGIGATQKRSVKGQQWLPHKNTL